MMMTFLSPILAFVSGSVFQSPMVWDKEAGLDLWTKTSGPPAPVYALKLT